MFSEVGQKQPFFGPWTRGLVRAAVLLVLGLAATLLWAATSPLPWTLLAERLVRDLPGTLEVHGIDLTGPGDPLDPATWEVTLLDVTWTPLEPTQPAFHADRVVSPMPVWESWSASRELHVPWARVVGLDLHLPTQRPPPPWTPTDAPLALRVDRLTLWDAHLQVDADDPLPALTAGEIYGELQSLTFQPGSRDFSALGHARVGTLVRGDLPFTGGTIGSIVADERGVVLDGVVFGLAAGDGRATLRFEGLLKRAATLTLDAELTSLRIQDIVRATSDRGSPVRGLASASVTLVTDPTAERGSAVLDAMVRIPALLIPMDIDLAKTGPVLRGALELFGYRAGDGLRIKSLYGPVQVGSGWISLDGLRSTLLGVPVEVRSRIDDAGVWILVRRLPRIKSVGGHDRSKGAVGLVIEGRHNHLWLRVATEGELQAGRRLGAFKNEGVKVGG